MPTDSQAALTTAFKYKIELSLMIGKKNVTIPQSSIKAIIINSMYDKNTMPVIYISLRLSSTIYTQMVLNSDKATLGFRIFKYDDKTNSSILEPYIEDNFSYIMPNDPNYNNALEQYVSASSTAYNDNSDSYLEGYIALISLKSISDNMRLTNAILKDTDIMSIVHKYTSHMTMCIEPFDNKDHIDQFIIPPITSVTALLSFLNDNYCFYKSGYRYFRSFDMTYLLSLKGNPVHEGSNKFDTVIISICDPIDDLGKSNAIELDRKNHAYIIYVDANDTSIRIDRFANKQYNSIIGVDTDGNTIQEELRVAATPDSTEKVFLERHDNLDNIYGTKAAIESLSVIVTVTKTEIDSTVLTPNKQYQIKHYSESREYDGKYILSYKKEILTQKGDSYIGAVMFGLRRIIED